jgi:hypothetical protein
MAMRIIDSKGFHRYMDAVEDIDYKIKELKNYNLQVYVNTVKT